MRACTFEAQRDHGVDLRIGFGDARFRRSDQFQRRHLTAFEPRYRLGCSPFYEFVHGLPSPRDPPVCAAV